MAFLTTPSQKAFREAIKAIEATSSVEVVVAVRARLRRWPSAHAAIGVMIGIIALAFTLYAETEFELFEILLVPVLAGMVGGLVVELIPPLQRALTPKRVRQRDLREASRATFYELGIHKTRGRTGLLAFVGVRDQAAALVGDVEVVQQVGQPALDRIAATLAAAIPEGGEAVAKALAAIDFSKQLPRAADDVNELPDEVIQVKRPRARARVA